MMRLGVASRRVAPRRGRTMSRPVAVLPCKDEWNDQIEFRARHPSHVASEGLVPLTPSHALSLSVSARQDFEIHLHVPYAAARSYAHPSGVAKFLSRNSNRHPTSRNLSDPRCFRFRRFYFRSLQGVLHLRVSFFFSKRKVPARILWKMESDRETVDFGYFRWGLWNNAGEI